MARTSLRQLIRFIVDVVKDTIALLGSTEMDLVASSLAFATVMSIVPLLAISLSVFQAYGGFEPLMARIEPFLLENLVAGAGADTRDAIHHAILRVHSRTLGLGGAAGLLVTSTRLFLDIETAVQRIWGLKKKRPLWLRLLIYWTIIFAGPLLLAVALGVLGSKSFFLVQIFPKGTVGFLFSFAGLFAIYKFVPACKVNVRAAGWSALLAAGAVLGAQASYALLTKRILGYNKIYGSLAAVPIFLFWILLLWWLCLGGVALTRSLQTRYERQSLPMMS